MISLLFIITILSNNLFLCDHESLYVIKVRLIYVQNVLTWLHTWRNSIYIVINVLMLRSEILQ